MLGAYICRELLGRGARVVGVARNPAKAAFLAEEGVEIRKADLLDRTALEMALDGCDALVSNAALYDVRHINDWDKNYAPNQKGTENVYAAAHAAGISRVVQISSFAVYRWELVGINDESTHLINGAAREGGAYRATKQMSEAYAAEFCRAKNMDLTILRPSGIYGSRDKNLLPYFRPLLRLPVVVLPEIHFPFVYAGDVARGVSASLENPVSIGRAYNTTGEDVSILEFLRAMKQVRGAGPLIMGVPLGGLGIQASHDLARQDLGFSNTSFTRALSEIYKVDPF